MTQHSAPVQTLSILRAQALVVCDGVNEGDAFSHADELVLDDIYEVDGSAELAHLSLCEHTDQSFAIAPQSELGQHGARVYLDSAVVLMPTSGHEIEALVFVEVDDDGMIADIYLHPLSPLQPSAAYRLVGVDTNNPRTKLAELASVSFVKGTRITTSTGAQVPIERLKVGDRILTRDSGYKAIRWIGQNTVRACGEMAPIVITAGTLNNSDDLIVSPNHRLLIYQRSDQLGVGTPKLMIKARYLVNGTSVYVQDGGFVDYYQILLDGHHIIYAEGIAAESLMINEHTTPALPQELAEQLQALVAEQGDDSRHGLDVEENLLNRPDAIELLKRASSY